MGDSRVREACALLVMLSVLVSTPTAIAGSAAMRSENWPVPAGLQEYAVLRVVDGDTIDVVGLGKVRYIGVNAPETKHPSRPVEWMGQEAYEANCRLVEGKRVKLEFDIETHDRYGRLLAYAYVGGTFVNAWLVEAGYAQVMTIPPNVRYAQLFLELEREAREAKRGLWAEEIKPENLLVLESRGETLEAGYEPCKVCGP